MEEHDLAQGLRSARYIPEAGLTTSLWLALSIGRPILLEGDAGVGKTAVAAALAHALDRRLIRLQCYEGLDLQQAVYEWNYGRQLLAIRLHERDAGGLAEEDLFAPSYLMERPLLSAILSKSPCVLLIDEIDRADEAFEAYLLEALADYQITIPELGTLTATAPPAVVLTSNGTRDLSDALRRRCLYYFLDYPTLAREIEIVRTTLPHAEQKLIEEAVEFVQRLRREELHKSPGIAETLDWMRALYRLNLKALPEDPRTILSTLSCLLKTREDRAHVTEEHARQLLEGRKISQHG
ncbi:MAG: AAA family ATPase [Thiobacillaceae bacterium]